MDGMVLSRSSITAKEASNHGEDVLQGKRDSEEKVVHELAKHSQCKRLELDGH